MSNIHLRANHAKEFVSANIVHINDIENYWRTIKRGVLGIYPLDSYKNMLINSVLEIQ
jgi:hypothetical protein